MNKEEKEAIERLDRKLTSEKFTKNIGMPVYIKDVEIVLNLIQKHEAIIDKMAEQLAGLAIWNDNIEEALILGDKEEVKEYFKKEVKDG